VPPALGRGLRRRSQAFRKELGSPGGNGALRKPAKPAASTPIPVLEDFEVIMGSKDLHELICDNFKCPKCKKFGLVPAQPDKVANGHSLVVKIRCQRCKHEMRLDFGGRPREDEGDCAQAAAHDNPR
jgi:hypothetical protein